MGETCSTCQNKNISLEELQVNEEETKPAPDTSKNSQKENEPPNKEALK